LKRFLRPNNLVRLAWLQSQELKTFQCYRMKPWCNTNVRIVCIYINVYSCLSKQIRESNFWQPVVVFAVCYFSTYIASFNMSYILVHCSQLRYTDTQRMLFYWVVAWRHCWLWSCSEIRTTCGHPRTSKRSYQRRSHYRISGQIWQLCTT